MSFTKIALAVAVFTITTVASADTSKIINPSNNHTYKRFDTAKTWSNAKLSCESLNGYLATITSKSENDWVTKKLLLSAPTPGIWIGGSDALIEGDWKWSNGDEWTYTNWNSGEPNGQTSENHLQIYAPEGTWNDLASSNKLSYICEWNPDPVASGVIHGFTSNTVNCTNETTNQTVQIPAAKKTGFNCELAGLTISPSDTVTITITGKIK